MNSYTAKRKHRVLEFEPSLMFLNKNRKKRNSNDFLCLQGFIHVNYFKCQSSSSHILLSFILENWGMSMVLWKAKIKLSDCFWNFWKYTYLEAPHLIKCTPLWLFMGGGRQRNLSPNFCVFIASGLRSAIKIALRKIHFYSVSENYLPH